MRAHDGDFQDDEPSVAEMLLHCLEWLDNIEACVGTESLIDHKPNNFVSRATMRSRAIDDAVVEREYRMRRIKEEAYTRRLLGGAS